MKLKKRIASVLLIVAVVVLVAYFGLALAIQFFLPPPSSAWLWVPSLCAVIILWAVSVLKPDNQ